MKKIITAIENPEINKKLKDKNICEILSKDIQYPEGILEFLESGTKIDMLFISELLTDKNNFYNLIIKIKNTNPDIEIVLFLKEESFENKNSFNEIGINKLYLIDDMNIELIEQIINKKKEEDILEEIANLKKILNEKVELSKSELKKERKVCNTKKQLVTVTKKKIISVTGTYSSGKTVTSILLGYSAAKVGINTIVIDFDIFKKTITILKNKQNLKKENIEDCIYNIHKNLDILCGIDKLFNIDNKLTEEKLLKLIDKLKQKYDFIIIDTSSEIQYEYVRILLNISEDILFIIEPMLNKINEAQTLINTYINKWNIEKNKFKIIINKVVPASISTDIIKKIFDEFDVIKKIEYKKEYIPFINNHIQFMCISKRIINQYFKIIQKLLLI